jgi:quinolinate synthase
LIINNELSKKNYCARGACSVSTDVDQIEKIKSSPPQITTMLHPALNVIITDVCCNTW